MKIAISSDSTCAISQKQAKEYGLFVLPLNVIINGTEYHDDIDISKDQLAKKMRGNAKISTSTPSPEEVKTFFDKIFEQGYETIIHFTISSKLSAIHEQAVLTAQELYGDKVIVIDSLSVCSFMAYHVLTALSLRDQGKDKDEIINAVNNRITSEYAIFIPESLTFLKNGGRVSPAVAMIGNFIGLKPVLDFKNGEIGKRGATRSLKKSVYEILKSLKDSGQYSQEQHEVHILVFDTSAINLEMAMRAVETIFPDFTVEVFPIAINVCAHTGPGTLGIGLSKKVEA
jgi:DegV family protein with EDD domain